MSVETILILLGFSVLLALIFTPLHNKLNGLDTFTGFFEGVFIRFFGMVVIYLIISLF